MHAKAVAEFDEIASEPSGGVVSSNGAAAAAAVGAVARMAAVHNGHFLGYSRKAYNDPVTQRNTDSALGFASRGKPYLRGL